MKKITSRLFMALMIATVCSCSKPSDDGGEMPPANGGGTEQPGDNPGGGDQPGQGGDNPGEGGVDFDPEAPVKWISEVLEFMPAPGQFVNTATADMAAAEKLAYTVKDGKLHAGKSTVSLGGFGGYVVFRFDHDVINRDGVDFVILGNAFGDAQYPQYSNSEPGIVQVAFDANGNGVRDDDEPWYELKSENRAEEVEMTDYEITYYRPDDLSKISDIAWTDNKGGSGTIPTSDVAQFYPQCIYPLAEYFADGNVPERLTFRGTKLKNNAKNMGGDGDSQYWTHETLSVGYADNFSDDYEAIVGDDPDTKGGNKFDISDAIDGNGNTIVLEKITFVRVYNPINQQCGRTGETSPEICGAISLTAKQ